MSEEELEGELQGQAEDQDLEEESQDQQELEQEQESQEENKAPHSRGKKDQCLVYLVPKSYLPQMRHWNDLGVTHEDMELQEKEDHYKVSLYNMGLLHVHQIGDILQRGHSQQLEQEARKEREAERKKK